MNGGMPTNREHLLWVEKPWISVVDITRDRSVFNAVLNLNTRERCYSIKEIKKMFAMNFLIIFFHL